MVERENTKGLNNLGVGGHRDDLAGGGRRGGGRGRRLRGGGVVIAGGRAERGGERLRVEAAVPERGAEGGDGEGAGERRRHCYLGCMRAPALVVHGRAAACLVCRWF